MFEFSLAHFYHYQTVAHFTVCDRAITDAYILIRAAIFARWKSFDLCVCHTIFPSCVKVQQFNLNPNRMQSHFNQTLPLDNDL